MKNIDQRVSEIDADPNRIDIIMGLEQDLKDACEEAINRGVDESEIIHALIEELGPKDLLLRIERINAIEAWDDDEESEFCDDCRGWDCICGGI